MCLVFIPEHAFAWTWSAQETGGEAAFTPSVRFENEWILSRMCAAGTEEDLARRGCRSCNGELERQHRPTASEKRQAVKIAMVEESELQGARTLELYGVAVLRPWLS